MAEQYGFADRMFQTNEGPSFPAHQYILSGTSTLNPSSTLRASENPFTPKQTYTGGCDAPQGSLVLFIDANGQELQEGYPCFDRPALTDLVDAKGLTWHYYQPHGGAALWNGPDAIKHIRDSSEYSTDVTWPPSKVLTDIAGGNLANVVWVMPDRREHPITPTLPTARARTGSPRSSTRSARVSIGIIRRYSSRGTTGADGTITSRPPVYNSYELGFRVPLVVISPVHAKKATSRTFSTSSAAS